MDGFTGVQRDHSEHNAVNWTTGRVSDGTTIMAVEFDGGVCIGADSRTNSGGYVTNRVADKLTQVSDYIYCCRSGSAADTQAIADIIKYHVSFYEMEMGEPACVSVAANLFKEMGYNYRDQLSAGIICAGWDKRYGGQVYTIPLGGMLIRQPVALGGSGSTYILGYVDSEFKPGMSRDECVKFVVKGCALAMSRDGSSGGIVRIGVITKNGIEKTIISGDAVPKFYEG